MKKMALGLSWALAAFGLFLSPVLAETGPPRAAPVLSVADHAFLTSLAKPVAAAPAAKPPAGGTKALCTATASCALGGTVNCEGNSSCSAVDGNCSWGVVGYVICDGHYYGCGGSCCPENFCTRDWQCAQSCYPCNYNYTCNWGGCSDDCECEWSTCPV
jgi:hypothetical protein